MGSKGSKKVKNNVGNNLNQQQQQGYWVPVQQYGPVQPQTVEFIEQPPQPLPQHYQQQQQQQQIHHLPSPQPQYYQQIHHLPSPPPPQQHHRHHLPSPPPPQHHHRHNLPPHQIPQFGSPQQQMHQF
jgi:hypothetical protein